MSQVSGINLIELIATACCNCSEIFPRSDSADSDPSLLAWCLVGLHVSEDISRQIPCSLLTHKCQPMKEKVKFAKRLGLQFRIFFSLHMNLRGLYVAFVLAALLSTVLSPLVHVATSLVHFQSAQLLPSQSVLCSPQFLLLKLHPANPPTLLSGPAFLWRTFHF